MNISWFSIAGRLVILAGLLFLPISVAANAEETTLPEGDETVNTKALVALYIIGSDLETNDNDATEGIQDILSGYEKAGSADPVIIIAYGGSKKPGWEGMTFATIEQLKQDLKDETIGNEDLYEYHDTDANMGSKESLKTFLSWIGDSYESEKRYLIFSDHGGGWNGFGSDENFDNAGMSIQDISGALEETGFKADLIGFDACLMGAIEVANAISPYSPLLVGSEESEPGEGWKYEGWIAMIAQDPQTDPVTIGKAIIDGYMEQEGKGKTLSLIDTTKTGDLVTTLDLFGEELSTGELAGTREFASAYRNLNSFGAESISVDLACLAESLQTVFPQLSEDAGAILEQVSPVVLYERHDPELSFATGLSIMSPENMTLEEYTDAGEGVSLGPGWDNAYVSLLQFLSDSAEGVTLEKGEDNRYEFDDPSGYAMVYAAYFMVGDGEWIIGTYPVSPDEDGSFPTPEWDGEWFMIQNADSPESGIIPAFETVETYEDGTMLLRAHVLVNQNEAFLEIETDGNSVEYVEIIPFTTDSEGGIMFGNSYEPEPGDEITTNTEGSPNQESITWTEETSVVFSVLPDGEYAVGLVVDQLTGSKEYVVDRYVTISDRQIVSTP